MTDSQLHQGNERAVAADAYPLTDEQLEHAVFTEIVALHPTHPTLDELHLALSCSGVELGRHAVEDSVWALRRFGLIRENGKVLEPTLTALHAAEVVQRA